MYMYMYAHINSVLSFAHRYMYIYIYFINYSMTFDMRVLYVQAYSLTSRMKEWVVVVAKVEYM